MTGEIRTDTGASVADKQWFGWSAGSDAAGWAAREWSTDGGSAYSTIEGAQPSVRIGVTAMTRLHASPGWTKRGTSRAESRRVRVAGMASM